MAGFALIEILVAFTIAVLALGALYHLASNGIETETTATRYSRALLIAQSALEAAGTEQPLVPGSSIHRRDDIYQEEVIVRVRPDLLRNDDALSTPYPYEVSIDIAWHDGRRARSLTLSTLRLGAAP
jgi:type II secretory pathway pseudopilin PulG